MPFFSRKICATLLAVVSGCGGAPRHSPVAPPPATASHDAPSLALVLPPFAELEGKVMTAAGPVEPSALGVTLPHEHLLFMHGQLNSARQVTNTLLILNDVPQARKAVRDFVKNVNLATLFPEHPGRTIVDLTNRGLRWETAPLPCACGSSPCVRPCNTTKPFPEPYPVALRQMGQDTGAQLVLSTGFYKDLWITPEVATHTVESLEQLFVDDLTSPRGIDGTGIRAGILGEVGVSVLTPNEEKVLVASALAQARTGAPINIHFDTDYCPAAWKLRDRVISLLEMLGVRPDRIVVSHMFSRAACAGVDVNAEMQRLAARGVNLEFDLVGSFGAPEEVWGENFLALQPLIDAGHATRLLASHDVFDWGTQGDISGVTPENDFAYSFIPNLLAAGRLPQDASGAHRPLRPRVVGEPDPLVQLLVTNPQRVLAFDRVETPPTPGLVTHLAGDGDMTNALPSSPAAIATPAAAYASGREGLAFFFDGARSLRVPYFGLRPAQPFSVSFWLKPDAAATSGIMTVLDTLHGVSALPNGSIPVTQGWTIQLLPSGGNLHFALGTGSDFKIVTSPVHVRDGGWHRVVATYTGHGAVLMVDGQRTELAFADLPVGNNADLFVGVWGRDGSRVYRGVVDELRLYHGTIDAHTLAMEDETVTRWEASVPASNVQYPVSAAFRADGTLFYGLVGLDNRPWLRTRSPRPSETWSDYVQHPLPGDAQSNAPLCLASGGDKVFAIAKGGLSDPNDVGIGNQGYLKVHQNGAWGAWQPLPSSSLNGPVACVADAAGNLFLFIRGLDLRPYYLEYRANGTFANYALMDAPAGTFLTNLPLAATRVGGVVTIYAKGGSGSVGPLFTTTLDLTTRVVGPWVQSVPASNVERIVGVAARPDGRQYIFVKGLDRTPYYNVRSAGGSWGAYFPLPGLVTDFPLSAAYDPTSPDKIEVFGVRSDTSVRPVQINVIR